MKLERTPSGIRLTLGQIVQEVAIGSPAHLAITRQGSQWSIWVNGILALSFSSNYPIAEKAATIGPVNTVLDEIRLTKEALYTAPFTPPDVPHQAWYQANAIFDKGQIAQGLGQIAGPSGQVIPNQTALYKGQILQGDPVTGAEVWPAQNAGAKGSSTSGQVIPFGIYSGQQEASKGSVLQGETPLFGHQWPKGFITQGTAPEPPPFIPPPTNTIPSQRQYAEGILDFGQVVLLGGTRIVPSQGQFTEGSFTSGSYNIFGNPTIPNKRDGQQGSFLSDATTAPHRMSKLAGQGNVLPPYTGWDPADLDRLMATLEIPVTQDNLERVQERLNEIRSLSVETQKRIQSLLAHRDGLWLELTRSLRPTLKQINPPREIQANWRSRHRSRLINKEQIRNKRQIEIATGINKR